MDVFNNNTSTEITCYLLLVNCALEPCLIGSMETQEELAFNEISHRIPAYALQHCC